MSNSEFLNRLGLPASLNLDDSLTLNASQRHELEKLIHKQGEETIDYRYDSRDVALARTSISDLKAAERRGLWAGAFAYGLGFYFIHKATGLASSFLGRRFVHLGSFFVGAAGYYAFTEYQYRMYSGVAHRINTRVSTEVNQMMSLRNTKKQ